jgi:hypothetical protein
MTTSAAPQPAQAIGPDAAEAIRSMLPQMDDQLIGLQGQATPKETGQRWLSWFVGLGPAEAEAKTKTELILDPSKITSPTPTVEAARVPARYAVVAVVVTDGPEQSPALRIARAPLKVVLEQ